MYKKLIKILIKFRIAILHAKFHRLMKRADKARILKDILKFKKCVYKSEDAWRKIVILTLKIKSNG